MFVNILFLLMNTQDTFQLPASCFDAIPFFKESDSLRENALCFSDLVVAYCLRWKGIELCVSLMKNLGYSERNYVKRVLDSLLSQLHTMKHSYNFEETEGTVRI